MVGFGFPSLFITFFWYRLKGSQWSFEKIYYVYLFSVYVGIRGQLISFLLPLYKIPDIKLRLSGLAASTFASPKEGFLEPGYIWRRKKFLSVTESLQDLATVQLRKLWGTWNNVCGAQLASKAWDCHLHGQKLTPRKGLFLLFGFVTISLGAQEKPKLLSSPSSVSGRTGPRKT